LALLALVYDTFYALSIGIMNGDLFRHILALSPEFTAPAAQTIGKSQTLFHTARMTRCYQLIDAAVSSLNEQLIT